ncbi:DinB family protein [Paenibacillus flagellatus]|uniref:DinB-like domain-containing protein n=1 Tax=Paenibacillus flagellatus TaxID=2211139 RepID=A0A2V5KA53_9BACL|nr:DinB family protein [Paenibacillus flagellatus]PYI56308.1 hypothetical protein DLM86_04815 [Paenibacillus flagellatus]
MNGGSGGSGGSGKSGEAGRIDELERTIGRVRRLAELDDETWLAPMRPGKWSVGETIAHLLYWDRLIVERRLPYAERGAQLASVDEGPLNAEAAAYARSGVSKRDVVDAFVRYRESFVAFLRRKTDDERNAVFRIGDWETTLAAYAGHMAGHDAHHLRQIDDYLDGIGR